MTECARCNELMAEIERLRAGFRHIQNATDLEMGDGDLARKISDVMIGPKQAQSISGPFMEIIDRRKL